MSVKLPSGSDHRKSWFVRTQSRLYRSFSSAKVYGAAAIASALFTYVESTVKPAGAYATPELYILARAALLFGAFAAYIPLTRLWKKERQACFSSLLDIKVETWIRGSFGSLCLLFMSIALWKNPTQTFSYSFFLLHPLFTLLLTPFLINRKVDYRGQFWPITLSVTGAIGYSVANQLSEQGVAGLEIADSEQLFFEYAAPALAGLAFAGENLMSKRIDEKYKLDSTTISFQSAFVMAITMPLCALMAYLIMGQTPRFQWETPFIGNLMIASALGLAANILITTAFAEASDAQLPTVAVLDLAVLPYAVLIGLAATDITVIGGERSLISPAGGMLFIIMVGATWSVGIRNRKGRQQKPS